MRPRLKRTIKRIDMPDGSIELLRIGGAAVSIADPSQDDRRLLDALDGSRSLAELQDEYPFAQEAVTDMQALGLIEDAADYELIPASERERFDRQLRYFSEVDGNGISPADAQRKLREAKVAVLGVGGLGGRIALDLASTGAGELWLIDGDQVEVSNLNRQIQYTEADVGELKVEVMADRIRAFNSAVTVKAEVGRLESEQDIAAFIAGADFVVDAADWPAIDIERWCNSACFAAGLPYIGMSHEPPISRVGPLYVPGVTGCYACQEIARRRDYPLYETAIEQMRRHVSPAPTLGPPCGELAGRVAADVMHYLTGLVTPPSLGAACIHDMRTVEVERERVVPEPNCPICSHLLDE